MQARCGDAIENFRPEVERLWRVLGRVIETAEGDEAAIHRRQRRWLGSFEDRAIAGIAVGHAKHAFDIAIFLAGPNVKLIGKDTPIIVPPMMSLDTRAV